MIGNLIWAIPEGYIPGHSVGSRSELALHEAACALHAPAEPASIKITLYFEVRDPAGSYRLIVASRRTLHLRFTDLVDSEAVPRHTAYSSINHSDVSIVVQHTRPDSRNPGIDPVGMITFLVLP